ncbi:ATP-binding protein [uncultured Eubacterium sp.]|jgi:DNA helicase HerA-like ATPase|uniref:ATP-binding protein n=1 Tax=uncultured Eubacterium sp. TaxID=165185 RepID=UPI002806341D|nr:ATP-binding protein [uncultured Eubacterium sp.]
MGIFKFEDTSLIGNVIAVDTSSVVVKVENEDVLSEIQVNNLVAIKASKQRQTLIGMVSKIIRKFSEMLDDSDEIEKDDVVKITLIGTLLDKFGTRENIFKRTLESVPEITAQCYIMNNEDLSNFMSVLSVNSEGKDNSLKIGNYTLNKDATAYLDGNRLFQKHAVIVGSTGSGKSCTVATLIEEIAKLQSSNAVVFDIHGEYEPIIGENIKHFKIAGPSDGVSDGFIYLPYWLLTYEEMISMMIDRSDNNAPNQAMIFSRTVYKCKKDYLISVGKSDIVDDITIDSPTPYDIKTLLDELNAINSEVVPGAKAGSTKKGDFNGTLSRFIQRLENKVSDKRLNFLFSSDESLLNYDYMVELCSKLMLPASSNGGVKIIDFSEVPSDVLPLVVSLVARLIFSVQQWTDREKINPIAIFCDEAHLYIPQNTKQGIEAQSLNSFERIAKEGRKYGIGLVVITQRPSEVDRTVLSQSSNFIAMRLTNADDQNVIKKLLPDSLGNFGELLPILDVGEALIVGDASLLPSRINVNKPNPEPNSATIGFWSEWSKESTDNSLDIAIESLRRQTKI